MVDTYMELTSGVRYSRSASAWKYVKSEFDTMEPNLSHVSKLQHERWPCLIRLYICSNTFQLSAK